MLTREKNGLRFDDLLVDGSGVLAKGSLELDSNGELQAANLPVFATSDGDKATIKADRGADGALRVVVRGDVFDGRNFVKTAMAGPPDPKAKARHPDLDIDVKIGVIAGHNGETIRGLDWRMSRRNGRVRTFTLNARIGRDTPLIGEIRTRVTNSRPVLYFETNDAGALFRLTDVYPRMVGGQHVARHGPAVAGRCSAGRHHQHFELPDPRRRRARPRGGRPAERRAADR